MTDQPLVLDQTGQVGQGAPLQPKAKCAFCKMDLPLVLKRVHQDRCPDNPKNKLDAA